MARRTLTVKRIDPWSVLKVGFLANLVLLGILLLAGRVVWFFIERLELIGRACEVAESVGFQDCGLNGGNIFRNALLLGLLGVVVQTGILVFAAFLHNLIAELTGGLTFTVTDDSAVVTAGPSRGAGRTGARPGPAKGASPAGTATAGAAGSAAAAPARTSTSPGPSTGAQAGAGQARPGTTPSTPPSSAARPAPTGTPASGDTTRVSTGQGDLFGGARPSAGGQGAPGGQGERPRTNPQGPHGPSRP